MLHGDKVFKNKELILPWRAWRASQLNGSALLRNLTPVKHPKGDPGFTGQAGQVEGLRPEEVFLLYVLHALHGDNIFAFSVKDCFSRYASSQ